MKLELDLDDYMSRRMAQLCHDRQQEPLDIVMHLVAAFLTGGNPSPVRGLLTQAMVEGRLIEADVAQERLEELVDRLDEGDIILSLDGVATAALMSLDAYEALTEGLDLMPDLFVVPPRPETIDLKPGFL